MVNRFGLKLLLVFLLVGFGIFYGVDLATRGMEHVNGPMEEAPASEGHHSTAPADDFSEEIPGPSTPSPAEGQTKFETAQAAPPLLEPKAPGLTEMIGRSLQAIAQFIVNVIVSIFDLFL